MLRGIESENFKFKSILSVDGKYNILRIINKNTEVEMDIDSEEIFEIINMLQKANELIIEN